MGGGESPQQAGQWVRATVGQVGSVDRHYRMKPGMQEPQVGTTGRSYKA